MPVSSTDDIMDKGFGRLQDLLLAMRAGDELRPVDAARASGLTEHVCHRVLEGLTRAGLMSHEPDGRFIRRTFDLHAS